uniref:Uncharacterized protein n=1 Tax=Salix viminalis TaxID=40686 RepID=A0A6N2KNK3_SALVM
MIIRTYLCKTHTDTRTISKVLILFVVFLIGIEYFYFNFRSILVHCFAVVYILHNK